MLKQEGRVAHSATSDLLRTIRAFRLHTADFQQTVSDFYASLDTPVSLSCAILWRYDEHLQLAQKEVDPSQYLDADSFGSDLAAVSFLRKSTALKTGIDLKKVALQSFIEAENNCKRVNTQLRKDLSSGHLHPDDWYVLNAQIRKIDRILGDFDIDAMLDRCSWGPGSSLSIRGDDTSSPHKFDSECDITQGAYDLFFPVLRKAYPSWGNLDRLRIVKGNSIVTVPKNAKTDRTIAIEPGLNVWIQLGIGRLIRSRLRFAGFNLDSDLKNQRGAFIGSLTDTVATIDFKAASDSISRTLVEVLLPPVWHTVLDAARSQVYTLKDISNISEKFSTMGNGFTFELESLIFVTLALAICEFQGADDSRVSIFGDDLILPVECVEQLTRICKLYGFTINTDKSYSSGYYRESCGSHYFNGQDVKPLFSKKRLSSLKDVYRLLNGMRLLAHRRCGNIGCDRRFSRAWHNLLSKIPTKLRFFGPLSAGDAVISANLAESSAKPHPHGWEGFTFKGIPSQALLKERDSPGLLLARLHSPSRSQSFGNDTPLRAKTKIVLKKTMFVALWYDYGPWITRV